MTTPTQSKAPELVPDDEMVTQLPDSSKAIAFAIKGEVDAQIATARAYPRDIKVFLDELKTMACSSVDVAASCFYKLKRKEKDGGTKFIEGPSVRFAELAACAYGNMRVQARTSHDDGSYVYCVGTALDLQRNVGIQIEARRRITNRSGQRFNDDMVAVTANAGNSIALRNATFRVIPRALWDPIYQQTKKTAVGDQKAFLVRRQDMIDYFVNKVGITVEQLCAYLEIANVEAMTFDDLENAIGVAQGLRDGDIKVDEIIKASEPAPTTATVPAGSTGLAGLTEKLKQEQAPPTPATPPAAETLATDPPPSHPAPTVEQTPPPATPTLETTAPPLSKEESNALDLELAAEDKPDDKPQEDGKPKKAPRK